MRNIKVLLKLVLELYPDYSNSVNEHGLCSTIHCMLDQDDISYKEETRLLRYLTDNRPKDDTFGELSKYLEQFADISDLAMKQNSFDCTDGAYWIHGASPRLAWLNYHISILP